MIIHYQLNIGAGFPALLYPLGGVYTFFFVLREYRKKKLPKTVIGNILAAVGWLLGANFMILGFFYWQQLGEVLVPVFMIFLAFWLILTGTSIKFKPLIICGIIVNLLAFVTLYFEWQYHMLFMSIASVIGFIVPGILFMIDKRQEDV